MEGRTPLSPNGCWDFFPGTLGGRGKTRPITHRKKSLTIDPDRILKTCRRVAEIKKIWQPYANFSEKPPNEHAVSPESRSSQGFRETKNLTTFEQQRAHFLEIFFCPRPLI
jgi:hypothetical protein